MKNLKLIKSLVVIGGFSLLSCEKESTNVQQKPAVFSEMTTIYDSKKENYCIVTVESSSKTMLDIQLAQLENLELIYDYPDPNQKPINELDINSLKPNQQNLDKLLSADSFVNLHYDFSNTLDFHKKNVGGLVGFGFQEKNESSQKSSFQPFLVQQFNVTVAGIAYISPYADGFSLNNIGPKSDWTLFKYPTTYLWGGTLSSGSTITAP